MNLKQLLIELKVSGIRLTEKTGINIYTLYSITGGKQISKSKEDYIISLIYSYYSKEIARLEVLKELRQNKEVI